MKLGRKQNNDINLVEVENGHEVNGERTEEQLYAEGYKKACVNTENDGEWVEYPTCFVFIEKTQAPEPLQEDEITSQEALDIITGGAI